jgi:hypothetical protein
MTGTVYAATCQCEEESTGCGRQRRRRELLRDEWRFLYRSYMNDEPAARADLNTLLHTAHLVEHGVEARLATVGLSLAKLAALTALAEGGESMPLTQLVDRLEADGLVQRQADPNDRRARLATLTAAGRKACKEGLRVKQEFEQTLLKKLTATESRTLAELLAKVKDS